MTTSDVRKRAIKNQDQRRRGLRVYLTLAAEVWAKVDARRGNKARSRWVADLVEREVGED